MDANSPFALHVAPTIDEHDLNGQVDTALPGMIGPDVVGGSLCGWHSASVAIPRAGGTV